MKQWVAEFKRSLQDKTFICSIIIFVLSYLVITGLALLVSYEIYMLIITAIAGWQVAGWSHRLAPKVKQYIFKD